MGCPVLTEVLSYGEETDSEDMYLAEVGASAGAEIVATRNATDFTFSGLMAYHPRELGKMISSS